ncbi:hypothetical protein OAI47_01840 [Rhodospirillaceae bacterium]|nr:hypothetical protein [Rhodospirillaceae bacterium]
MLKFDKDNKTLSKLKDSNLKTENLLERGDLQKAIVDSWDAFRNEIGFFSAILIGQEINPDPSTSDRLDILALDPEDSSLIIFELKRDKNKLHLLQAISYAAMVSNKEKNQLAEIARKQKCYEYDELIEVLETTDLSSEIKIVLLAESFHPEVIITADWLKNYGVMIYAFALKVHPSGEETHLSFEQKYPLKELTEAYDSRKNRNSKSELKRLSWEDVISTCEYTFAERAITMCKQFQEGDPSRKRFIHIIKDYHGFDAITFFFRRRHINIYLKGGDNDLFETLLTTLPKTIQTGSWRDGFSIQLKSESEFKAFIELDSRFNY